MSFRLGPVVLLLCVCSQPSWNEAFKNDEQEDVTEASDLRFVSIGSDDWGRWSNHGPLWPDQQTRQRFKDAGLWLSGGEPSYQTVEKEEDVWRLLSTLDALNKEAAAPQQVVLTPFFIVAGPDFQRMHASGCPGSASCTYHELWWHNSSAGLAQHPYVRGDLREAYRSAFERGLWHPEYHGRSHVDARAWAAYLREGDAVTSAYFEAGLTYYGYGKKREATGRYQSTHSEYVSDDQEFQRSSDEMHQWVHAGVSAFASFWGYAPSVTACPCHYCSDALGHGHVLADNGIMAVQGEEGGRGMLKHLESVSRVMYDVWSGQTGTWEAEEDAAWRRLDDALREHEDVAVQIHAQNFMSATYSSDEHVFLDQVLPRLVTRLRQWRGGGKVIFVTAWEQVQLRLGRFSLEVWHECLRYRNYSPSDIDIVVPDPKTLYTPSTDNTAHDSASSQVSDQTSNSDPKGESSVRLLHVRCIAGADEVDGEYAVGQTITLRAGCEYEAMWGQRMHARARHAAAFVDDDSRARMHAKDSDAMRAVHKEGTLQKADASGLSDDRLWQTRACMHSYDKQGVRVTRAAWSNTHNAHAHGVRLAHVHMSGGQLNMSGTWSGSELGSIRGTYGLMMVDGRQVGIVFSEEWNLLVHVHHQVAEQALVTVSIMDMTGKHTGVCAASVVCIPPKSCIQDQECHFSVLPAQPLALPTATSTNNTVDAIRPCMTDGKYCNSVCGWDAFLALPCMGTRVHDDRVAPKAMDKSIGVIVRYNGGGLDRLNNALLSINTRHAKQLNKASMTHPSSCVIADLSTDGLHMDVSACSVPDACSAVKTCSIVRAKGRGVLHTLDAAYQLVKNEYVLHTSEDWLFHSQGDFLAEAIGALKAFQHVWLVSLRNHPLPLPLMRAEKSPTGHVTRRIYESPESDPSLMDLLPSVHRRREWEDAGGFGWMGDSLNHVSALMRAHGWHGVALVRGWASPHKLESNL